MSLPRTSLGFATSMYAHQKSAVEKLSRLKVGALFMEMGTGKTRTALELGVGKVAAGRARHVVWFCPVSTMGNLCEDVVKHLPGARVYRFCGKTRPGEVPGADVYVVGLESLSSSLRVFECCEGLARDAVLVVDESHLIKNHQAVRTCRLFALGRLAAYRFILTGTELTQGVEDLYSQMCFLSEKILGYSRFREFEHYHLEYWDGYPRRVRNRRNVDVLVARMAPYVYRVSKDECLDLPEKCYECCSVEMSWEQRERYEQVKEDVLYATHAFDWGDATIYKLFTGLQRVVSGYYPDPDLGLVPIFGEGDSPRLAELRRLLQGLRGGRKVIVWCKFTLEIGDVARVAGEVFGEEAVCRFYGGLKKWEREEEIRRFKGGVGRVLVANQACGGLGLNLVEASYVVYYSNVFKMSQRLQSEDRCHRIGQTRRVTYVDIICERSIDDVIMRCQGHRMNCIDEFREKLETIREIKDKDEAQEALRREIRVL